MRDLRSKAFTTYRPDSRRTRPLQGSLPDHLALGHGPRAPGRRPRPAASATCACRSPTAATSAASTACRPRGCRGSSATRCCASRRSSALVALLAAMGVGDVRLTGGEPLVRRDFPRLAGMLAAARRASTSSRSRPTATCSSATPRRSWRAGVDRFNVSIDSLQRDRFFAMTRRDALPQVLRGLEALAGFPEAHPIKVNAVAIRGFTEHELLPFARFAREHPYEVRFIEFMPLDADHAWTRDQVLTGAEIRAAIDASGRWSPSRASPPPPRASTASPTAAADRLHQPGLRAVLRRLQPHPPDRRRAPAHVPVLAQRDRPARAAARGRERRRARADRPRRRCGARSSSTTSTSRASSSPSGRCRASAADRAQRRSAGRRLQDVLGGVDVEERPSSAPSSTRGASARRPRRAVRSRSAAAAKRVKRGAARSARTAAAGGRPRAAPPQRRRGAATSAATRSAIDRAACRPRTTSTARPPALRSAWTMPASGWRGSSGSIQTRGRRSGGRAVSRLATTTTSSSTRAQRVERPVRPAAGPRARRVALSPPMRRPAPPARTTPSGAAAPRGDDRRAAPGRSRRTGASRSATAPRTSSRARAREGRPPRACGGRRRRAACR